MTAPLVIGPQRGYRYWFLRRRDGQPVLQSHFYPTLWPVEGPLQARCAHEPGPLMAWVRRRLHFPYEGHAAPTRRCQCGIYAFANPLVMNGEPSEPEELIPQVCRDSQFDENIRVFGVVLLWGRVIQHEYGYRAEYAKPAALLTDPTLAMGNHVSTLIGAVAERYALRIVSHVEDLLEAA